VEVTVVLYSEQLSRVSHGRAIGWRVLASIALRDSILRLLGQRLGKGDASKLIDKAARRDKSSIQKHFEYMHPSELIELARHYNSGVLYAYSDDMLAVQLSYLDKDRLLRDIFSEASFGAYLLNVFPFCWRSWGDGEPALDFLPSYF